MTLHITPLCKAYEQLKKSMDYLHSPLSKQDTGLHEQFRNSVIQCFEYTYEIAYKMIRRQLSLIMQNPSSIKEINFADLMRTAAEAGLISDVKRFLHYREMRNMTSHTYDELKAESIVQHMDAFYQDIGFLINELKKRNP